MSAALAGTSSVTGTLSNGASVNAPTFSPITFSSVTFSTRDQGAISAAINCTSSVTADLTEAAIVVVSRPQGGGWVNPTYIKDKKRKRKVIELSELEELYNRILGLVPDEPTKAQARVVARVQKVVAPGATELPSASEVDFAAIEAKAVRVLREAHERLLEDDDEAVIAYLLAA
jgi:hypothetical protein